MIVAFAPMEAPVPTRVFTYSSFLITLLLGLITLVKTMDGPRKYIVFAYDAGVNGNIVLYFYVTSQLNIGRYDHILAQVAFFANYGTGHNM